jgi:hypothetical protein
MKTPLKNVLAVAAVLSFAAVAAQAAQAQGTAAPYAGALVSEWTGKVKLQLPGMGLAPPGRGEKLPAGTLIDTHDGMMVLVLEDESEILLRPHTQLVLRDPGPGHWNYFELLLGRIRASIRKRTGDAPPFQLGTPSAVIAVRGTRFDVDVSRRNVTEVDVYEGLVEVDAVAIPGASVMVQPGFSTRVGPGLAPQPPVPTSKIQPGAENPNESLDLEFQREKSGAVGQGGESGSQDQGFNAGESQGRQGESHSVPGSSEDRSAPGHSEDRRSGSGPPHD